MKFKLITILLVLILCSCKEDTNIINEIKSSLNESSSEARKLDFNKTQFKDRAEELMYISEYLKQELPAKFLREQPKAIKDGQYYYIAIGKDYTLHEVAVKVIDSIQMTQTLMLTIMQKQLSLNKTKELLKQWDLRNQKYISDFNADTESNNTFNNDMQYAYEEKELIKIYPNVKSNFAEYHTEHYASNNKQIKFIYKVEHIAITEMVITDESDLSTEDEFQYGSINGTLLISGTNYSVKGGYEAEGNFEGIAYNINGDVYATLSWSYMYDNSISVRVNTENNSKDYDLAFIAKSTTIKSIK